MSYSDKVIIDQYLDYMKTDPTDTFKILLMRYLASADIGARDALSRVVRAYIAELIARYKGQINVNKIMGLADRSNDRDGTRLHSEVLKNLMKTISDFRGFSRDDMSHYVVFYESEAAKAIRDSDYKIHAPSRELSRNMGF
jgi:hypothetical protein